MHKNNPNTTSFFQKIHDKHPKLAQKLRLGTGLGTMVANSVAISVPLYGAGLAKTLFGSNQGDKAVLSIANHWINTNNRLLDTLMPKRDWRISVPDDLKKDGRYLLVCNHQSWVDTSVVQYVSESRLPITRFFAKHELLYIPIVGQAFYFLDFPMMKRHSKAQIAKNPALATRDLEEARRACGLLADKPFVLLNYLEGTRFSKDKHARQNSPYQHLLKPKAGGFALAIASLGDKIDGILDMTVVYPENVPDYGELWAGKMTCLGVDIRHLDMDERLFADLKDGKYDSDETVKAELFDFLDKVWTAKDERIGQMMREFEQV
ncbi:1-acyl-sn-glycerol-3-phosphate acyltransferase [Moraxella bovis]|uniref:acetyltransferase n=1 Tax=Moraxella bovis TaxID=476 RepID=UPI0022265DFD|nr:acetyltransferase [Moraxella bovis]UYZ68745.1 1-acyl-sn-glycerol-3-phosphate acyltransferase [Moraxella bovis]UYZ72961.1 1-acyl-sn-glycerol-3-phosphate acyltransferase [Moraxella bovis]UZA14417.1 1-acyl-sn-glycerol-3-phosphate acyltransferase [Moraxella bovis]UZA27223.1 1-acyl-sn-glycerol-3-phosphate acyltransferase [Moraxella bovis]UZA38244.1 1-acyl-sn-glycerol-3-phosphate acyltransferase [Moraxella bovis]